MVSKLELENRLDLIRQLATEIRTGGAWGDFTPELQSVVIRIIQLAGVK